MKNVILLTLDAFRRDSLGCYGNKDGLTPFIDSLRDKCLIFSKVQATGPYTQASFPGILTASHYLEYGEPSGLSPKRTLISEPLKKAGIATAAFHSNPYLSELAGWNRGWDIFYDAMEEEYGPRTPFLKGNMINNKVKKWLHIHITSREYEPFFLWVHYMDAHEPYIPKKKYLEMIDLPVDISEDYMFSLFRNTLLRRDVSHLEEVVLLKKLYNAGILGVDNHVEEFFNILEEFNILKDTLIIITSDHGDEFGEHGGLSHDDKMYSELIDVPLLFFDSARNGEQVCDTLVSTIDISPTILSLFGLKSVANFEGRSLLPPSDYYQKGVFGEAVYQKSPFRGDPDRGPDMNRDIYFYRENDLKIIYRANPDSWEMYDLKSDPKEAHNIVNSSDKADEMKSCLEPRVRRWEKGQEGDKND